MDIAIDTSVLVGLLDPQDLWHAQAVALHAALKSAGFTGVYFDCAIAETISTATRRLGEKKRINEIAPCSTDSSPTFPSTRSPGSTLTFRPSTPTSSPWFAPQKVSSTSTMRAMAVQGQYAYIGAGPRLLVLDVSDPASPTLFGQSEILSYLVRDVAVVGGYAYVADGSGGGLQIIHVADPAHPTQIGSYDTPGTARRLAVAGGYAYVADGSAGGLRIIDISDPANPVWLGDYDTPMSAEDVAAAGDPSAGSGQAYLYVGGAFTVAGGWNEKGGVTVNHVARWDASRRVWSALGGGLNGAVNALALDGSGNLYAGGDFTEAGGVSADHIARWDGTTWSALGSGLDGSVETLLVDGNGDLYVGGSFTMAGSFTVSRIARWDGTSWWPLGPGLNSTVYTLVAGAEGTLYAGGSFTTAGAITVNRVAHWDETDGWSALGDGVGSTAYATVYALAFDASAQRLYAAGSFTSAGGAAANYVAHWDGAAWSPLGLGLDDWGRALALDGSGGLYVGGDFTQAGGATADRIAHWDGTDWSTLGSGLSGDTHVLALDGTGHLYAGGKFGYTADWTTLLGYIARWDGSQWSAFGAGLDDDVYALVEAGDDVYAGGHFSHAGSPSVGNVARWDGASWHALGSGTDGYVLALAWDGHTQSVYVGGAFTTAGGVSANHIARWDGTSWHALGSGVSSSMVEALAFDASTQNLYVGGQFTTAGGVSANNIARWDGTSWHALGSGVNGRVRALALDGSGNLYAGGGFNVAGGATANYVAQWDGATWSPLGAGVTAGYPMGVAALAVDSSDNLYAGGDMDTAGGLPVNHIARWDGANWSALGSGLDAPVNALALDGNDVLYVGGRFTTAGGAPANYVVQWDGAGWSALGSGVDGVEDYLTYPRVGALAFDSHTQSVYAGGHFGTAGGRPSWFIARWSTTAPPASLAVNYATGSPGSFFKLTGTDYPPDGTATVVVNGHTLGAIQVDAVGSFAFHLDTSQASAGHYLVTATVNPSAGARFVLDAAEPLRPQEGGGAVLQVPEGIAFEYFVYLPLVQR